jgi:hypothetical protein
MHDDAAGGDTLTCSDLQTSAAGIANIGGSCARRLQLRIPHRREITATEPRLIANGIANIGLVRTLIAGRKAHPRENVR